jgi:pimeloyl-ACP methyl ester carboxylesterase
MKGDEAATQEITNVMKDDRTKDMIFTLNELEKVNRENPLLVGIFDFDKVGAFGHSFGGASAVRLGQLDQRVSAVAVLDSDIFYVIPEDSKPLFQPVLYMTAANIDESAQGLEAIGKSDALTSAYFRKHSPYYFIKIAGTTHQSFQTDAMFLAPYITIGGQSVVLHASDTTPARISQVISTYVMAFFDQQLNGIDQPLLNRASDMYPEISIEVKK